MEKQSYVDGRLISITSRCDHQGNAVVMATLYLGQNIESLSLSFPMKSMASANGFVSAADQDTFIRAAAKINEEIEMLNQFETGLQRAITRRIPTPKSNISRRNQT